MTGPADETGDQYPHARRVLIAAAVAIVAAVLCTLAPAACEPYRNIDGDIRPEPTK